MIENRYHIAFGPQFSMITDRKAMGLVPDMLHHAQCFGMAGQNQWFADILPENVLIFLCQSDYGDLRQSHSPDNFQRRG